MKVDYPRIFDVRKPDGFVPAVQRWSIKFPETTTAVHVAFFAAQGDGEEDVRASGFLDWASSAMKGDFAPISVDHSRFIDAAGKLNRVVTAYWVQSTAFDAWCRVERRDGWWESDERLTGACGFWREMLTVPIERFESIYWEDYPAALSKALPIEPTPYCGYFGAMRDRVPLAACDPLMSGDPSALSRPGGPRSSRGKRWMIYPPHNMTMIRSASFWGRCDEEQKADYDRNLRDPLAKGMDFLGSHPEETGCCTLRFQQTLGTDGEPVPETHAHGYFLSLKQMEDWAESHASHTAIFGAAISRYKKYGAVNQLRTWHEVYVLPAHGQHFEYINCHERTGLLEWFTGLTL